MQYNSLPGTSIANSRKGRRLCEYMRNINIYYKLLPVAVIILTALLYSKAVFNGFVDYDDNGFVLNNPYLRDFSWHGFTAIFTNFIYGAYSPLTTLLYYLTYNSFGLNPLPYHLLNVLIHLLNVWLVFKVTHQLSGKKFTALVVMVLFAVHPMNAESVAWVSSLKDVLFAFFYLLSLSFYLRYLKTGLLAKYYHIALVFFIASLMSKSAAVTLPVLLIAIDIYKGRVINLKSLSEKVPFLLLSVLFGILTIFSEGAYGALNENIADYSFLNRLFILSSAITSYIIKVVAPVNLSAAHYLPGLIEGRLPLAYYCALPLLLLFLLFIAWFALKKTSSFLRKEIIFGLCFFFITISVMLRNCWFGYMHTCERYVYITYIGLFYIIGQFISKTKYNTWIYVTIPAFSIVIIAFCFQTWERIGIWKNDLTLCTDVINENPDATRFYYMRANFEKNEGDIDDAIADCSKCIELEPKTDYFYYSRSSLYDMSGNIELAIKDYNMAIELKPTALMYSNRGFDHYRSGDMKSAMADYDNAILLDPTFSKAYFNRATLKINMGDLPGAIEDYNSLLKMNLNIVNAYFFRGIAYVKMNDTLNACKDWRRAAELGNEKAPEMIRQFCR